MGTRSYNVADHQAVLQRDQRQLRNPAGIVAQPRNQRRFARIPTRLHWRCVVLGPAERGSRDRMDRLNVVGKLTSNHHHGTVGPFADVVNAFAGAARPTRSPVYLVSWDFGA